MNVLDLFSGIGGFSLGLERAGMRTVAFCEIEPYCRAVLKKHWPNVPCYDDVRTLTADKLYADGLAIDVICGGFPCQDVSQAGPRTGVEGGARSGLWAEYYRLIGELRPDIVIVENVAALCVRGLDRVLGDLATLRFNARWDCIPASTIGALHERDRIWIVAYTDKIGCPNAPEQLAHYGKSLKERLSATSRLSLRGTLWNERIIGTLGLPDGVPTNLGEIAAYGNSVVPQITEIIGCAIMSSYSAVQTQGAK